MTILNPRYLAYCRANGNTPQTQMEHDREQYPGGCMAGFMVWMSQQWTLFEAAHAMWHIKDYERPLWRCVMAEAFDIWLTVEYPPRCPACGGTDLTTIQGTSGILLHFCTPCGGRALDIDVNVKAQS